MISECVEFVNDYFDNQFSPVNDEDDTRIIHLRKFCNTLTSMRKKRTEKGSVITTVQIMDNLKYLEASFHTLIRRIESNEIKIYNENNEPICDITLATFGNSSDTEDHKPKPIAGWTGSITSFMELMGEVEPEQESTTPGSNSFYLRSVSEKIIKDKVGVEYIIFAVVIKNDASGYDTAATNVIGIPAYRKEAIHRLTIRNMFGYTN